MALITAVALFFVSALVAAVSRQLTDEFKAWVPWIVRRVIQRAVARLPEDQRERFEEEWQGHVDEVPGEIGKLYVALGFPSAARKMASIQSADGERTRVTDLITRAFDLGFSGVLLFLLLPVLLLITLCLWLEGSGQIVNTEKIMGLNGRVFNRYRFSTSGTVGNFLEDRFSISYIPAIFNILRGEMAVVGPTPHELSLAEQLCRLVPGYSERTKVKPGLIGLAVVSAEPVDPLTELRLDLFYIENRSLKFDLHILGRALKMRQPPSR